MGIKKIGTKISLIFIVVILTVVLISNAVIYKVVSNIVIQNAIKSQSDSVATNTTIINNLLASINHAVYNLCRDGDMVRILNEDVKEPFELYKSRDIIDRQFRQYFIQLMDLVSYRYAFLFIEDSFPVSDAFFPRGINESSTTRNGVFTSKYVKEQAWYAATEEKDGAYYCFFLEEDDNHIYISRLVKNPYLNKYAYEKVGILLICMDIEEFANHIDISELAENAQVALIDENDRMIFNHQRELLGEDVEKSALFAYLKTSGIRGTQVVKFENEKYAASVSNLKWGWTLISAIPYSSILSALIPLTRVTMLVAMLAFVLGVAATIGVSGGITKPIRRLASAMNSIESEETIKIKLEYLGDDEVKVLYKSFNKMMYRIETLVSEAHQSAVRQKVTELKALQAQINPHFVYNTLDSVNWIALCNNQDTIVSMVSSLASIMKYSIREPDQLTTLGEELSHTKNYVNIQSQRYEDSFTVDYHVGQEYMELKLPKFLIQPLVENSIVHGVAAVKYEGRIEVSLQIADDTVLLCVSDNGRGADPEILNDYLLGKELLLQDSDGFGIRNVHERIRINFGEEYGLSYRAAEGGLIAEIRIPKL